MPICRKGLVLIVAALLGLVYFKVLFAGARTPDLRADLVAVINMNPSNPLGGEIWLMDLKGRPVRRTNRCEFESAAETTRSDFQIVPARSPAAAKKANKLITQA
ncbi:hypothetical protein EPO44_08685 [bacterium]|nr:MAG: hypothetical protein EPO44_08685 [bacterium]